MYRSCEITVELYQLRHFPRNDWQQQINRTINVETDPWCSVHTWPWLNGHTICQKSLCVCNHVPFVIWMMTSSLFIASFSGFIYQTQSTCEYVQESNSKHRRGRHGERRLPHLSAPRITRLWNGDGPDKTGCSNNALRWKSQWHYYNVHYAQKRDTINWG